LAFYEVGDITGQIAGLPQGAHGPIDFMSEAHLFNIAGHAAVGCLSAVASGAGCGPSALAGAITSFAGPLIDGRTFSIGSLVANSVVGGLAAVAGSGKFENGAITGAFGYLFNEVGSYAQRGYEPTFSGITVCNAGYGGVCVTEGVYDPTSPWREGAAAVAGAAAYAPLRLLRLAYLAISDYLPSGLGDLTRGEVNQIQNVVDQAGRPLYVVGSAARGARGPGSDIDYVTSPGNLQYIQPFQNQLPGIDPKTGVFPGVPNPNIGPSIPFFPRVGRSK
jgi:hypothetical protein